MDIINQLGIIAISSRLKRLSDSLLKDAAKIYKKYDADFMMKWYPVLIYLSLKSPLSLAEIASALSYAHPSVIELINEMEVNMRNNVPAPVGVSVQVTMLSRPSAVQL